MPLTRAASRGDQLANAAYAVERGWSRVLEEHELDTERLCGAVRELYAERDGIVARLADAGLGDGTATIAEIITRFARP